MITEADMQFIFVSIPANNCLKTATQKAYPLVFSRLCLLDTEVVKLSIQFLCLDFYAFHFKPREALIVNQCLLGGLHELLRLEGVAARMWMQPVIRELSCMSQLIPK